MHTLLMLQKMVKNIKISSILPFHIVWYETENVSAKLVYCKNNISFWVRLIFLSNSEVNDNNSNKNPMNQLPHCVTRGKCIKYLKTKLKYNSMYGVYNK